MDKKILALALPLMFILIIPTSFAEPYNITDSNTNYFFSKGAQAPYDPKIACSGNYPDRCVMMVYSQGFFGNKVQVFYSTNGFDVATPACSAPYCVEIGSYTIDFSGEVNSYFPYYHLPYDVVWDAGKIATNAFFIVIADKTYRYLPGVDNSGFPFYAPAMNDAAVADITEKFSLTSCISSDQRCRWKGWGLSFNDDDPEDLFVGVAYTYNPSGCTPGSNCPGLVRSAVGQYNITSTGYGTLTAVAGESPDDSDCVCALDPVGPGNCPSSFNVDSLMGAAFANGGTFAYKERMSSTASFSSDIGVCTDTDTAPVGAGGTTNVAFPPNADSQHHVLGNDLYWMNVTDGIYKASVSGFFAGYGTSELVHGFVNGEVANESDSNSVQAVFEAYNRIVWNYYNDTGSNLGIYVYSAQLIPIYIDKPDDLDVSAVLSCTTPGGESYSDYDSGTGAYLELATPCLTGNTIVLSTSGSVPADFDFTFNLTGCESTGYFIQAYYEEGNPVDFEFQVNQDPFFGTGAPIQDAVVSITTVGTQNTSASGSTTFSLNSILGADFDVSYGTCEANLLLDGTPRTFSYTISKSGFDTITGTITPATKHAIGDWEFNDRLSVSMEPFGIKLLLSLELAGGIPFEPCNSPTITYTATVEGAQETYVRISGYPTLGNTVTHFPASLVFDDNRSSFPVNITLYYNGDSKSENVTVTDSGTTTKVFIVEEPLTNLPCSQQCDCVGSSCFGQYYWDNIGCFNGYCNYTAEDCTSSSLCDDAAGCFITPTTTTCSVPGERSNCASQCLDSTTLLYGVCGSDYLCYNKTKTCTSGCNLTANVCEEERLCLIPQPQKFKVGENEYTLTCDVNNAGTTFCGDAMIARKTEVIATYGSVNNLPITPDGWNYIETTCGDLTNGTCLPDTAEIYYFLAPIITCSSSCEMSIQYCTERGCEDGECVGTGVDVSQGRAFVEAIRAWWFGMFPTMWDQAFIWTILTLLGSFGLSAGLAFIVGRNGGGSGSIGGHELGTVFVGSSIAFFLLGVFIGTMPFFMGIIFAVIAGFLLWRVWQG